MPVCAYMLFKTICGDTQFVRTVSHWIDSPNYTIMPVPCVPLVPDRNSLKENIMIEVNEKILSFQILLKDLWNT